MINLNEFVSSPEMVSQFLTDLKTGKINLQWKEIFAHEEKLNNLHEMTFGTLVQLADSAQQLNAEKVAPVLGKLFILMRALEVASENNETKKLAEHSQQFEVALKELAQLFTAEHITIIVQSVPKDPANINPREINPLLALLVTLKMLVHADILLDEDDDDEEFDECCEDEEDSTGCC